MAPTVVVNKQMKSSAIKVRMEGLEGRKAASHVCDVANLSWKKLTAYCK